MEIGILFLIGWVKWGRFEVIDKKETTEYPKSDWIAEGNYLGLLW